MSSEATSIAPLLARAANEKPTIADVRPNRIAFPK